MHTRRPSTPNVSGLRPLLQWIATATLTALLTACGGGSGPDFTGAGVGNAGTPSASQLGAGTPVTGLKISEISSCFSYTVDCWIEVYNADASSIDLSHYKLVSPSRAGALGPASAAPTTFDLPNINVPSHGYVVIAGYTDTAITSFPSASGRLAWVRNLGGVVPYWGMTANTPSSSEGFVQIINATAVPFVAEDMVLLGAPTQVPFAPNGPWNGGGVATLVSASGNTTKSIVRSQFTSSQADWVAVNLSTPGGRNDVAGGTVSLTGPTAIQTFGGVTNNVALNTLLANNGYLSPLIAPNVRASALQAIVSYLPGN